jgi:hypothetical protein
MILSDMELTSTEDTYDSLSAYSDESEQVLVVNSSILPEFGPKSYPTSTPLAVGESISESSLGVALGMTIGYLLYSIYREKEVEVILIVSIFIINLLFGSTVLWLTESSRIEKSYRHSCVVNLVIRGKTTRNRQSHQTPKHSLDTSPAHSKQ